MSSLQTINRLQGWLTKDSQEVVLGMRPPNSVILRSFVQTTEAWNSDGSNTMTVGDADNTDSIITSLDIASTGVKSPSNGSDYGFQSVAEEIKAYYSAGGSAPTTGKTFILIEFAQVPPQP